MRLSPTLSALLRNRSGPLLVALQTTIALAALVNTLNIVHQHYERMSRPTHIDEANLFGLSSVEYTARFDYDASLREDLAWLRALPGVVDATPVNSVPLGGEGNEDGMSTLPDGKGRLAKFDVLEMDEHGINTLGVRLLSGRNFRSEEILPAQTVGQPKQVIITRALGARLFPHENALGRTVYDDDPMTVIGIIDDMAGIGGSPQVALFPKQSQDRGHGYLVRTVPGRRDALMRQVAQHLASSNENRVIRKVRSIEENKRRLYASDSATGGFLLFVTLLLIAVTALGVFSLTTFNVSTRTRQIGTRRAVGARRRDIVRHFLAENSLIVTAGALAGSVLALLIGSWLSAAYSVPRVDLIYLGGGVFLIVLVAHLAAWWPARRAATVPPSVATRTI